MNQLILLPFTEVILQILEKNTHFHVKQVFLLITKDARPDFSYKTGI